MFRSRNLGICKFALPLPLLHFSFSMLPVIGASLRSRIEASVYHFLGVIHFYVLMLSSFFRLDYEEIFYFLALLITLPPLNHIKILVRPLLFFPATTLTPPLILYQFLTSPLSEIIFGKFDSLSYFSPFFSVLLSPTRAGPYSLSCQGDSISFFFPCFLEGAYSTSLPSLTKAAGNSCG